MKSTEILDLMLKDHGKLVALLSDVEKTLGSDTLSIMKAFERFEWELQKHFFTEEKAIFTSYNPTDIREGYKMVPELIQEHNQILHAVEMMRRDLRKQKPYSFSAFKESLMSHRRFEEEQLYPKLDQELSEEQKQNIVNRIKEIV